MSTPTPPPYPYFPPPSGPPPFGPAGPFGPDGPPARRPRTWRWVVAGGLAGGLLGAAVAGPVAWQLAADRSVADQEGGAQGIEGSTDPGISAEPFSRLPDGLSIPDFQAPGSQRPTGTAADDDQSRGVLLVETKLQNGGGAGTAMVLDSSGIALTNYHVVEGSTTVRVTVASTGESYDADVLGFDEESDVALLQVRDAGDLEVVDLDDDELGLGDDVTAVGNALGGGELLASSGEVTGLDEQITAQDGMGSGADAEDLTGLIEADAPVVPGYSGGPLLDEEGEVVGITTATSTDAPQTYAVPIDEALAIAERIEDGDEGDGVQIGPSGYLGLGVSDTAQGVLVESVEEDGAAGDAGVAVGDRVTGVDGTTVREYADLAAALSGHEPGDAVELTWTNAAGRQRSATVTLGESPVN